MTMDMANAAVEVPVTVLTAEVMEGPTGLAERGWPGEDAEILAGILLSLPTSISQTAVARKRRPFLGLRRPERYTLMQTEPGIGMLTVDYAVMAELRRI